MDKVQYLEKDGKPAFAVVPIELWERLRKVAEDAGDIAAFDRAMAEDDGIRIPANVAYAIADGESPLRAWRKHRQLTIQQLADAARLTKAFVSQIETGKRVGTAETLRSLATALKVEVGALVLEA